MSTSGHWIDPETREQYLEAVAALQASTSAAYTRIVTDDLEQIKMRLETLVLSDLDLATKTQQQLRDVIELFGGYKSRTAGALLSLEQEIKQIREALAKSIKSQSDLDMQKLEIEKSKLQLDRWKLALGAIGLFLTGLLFPYILWLLGVKP